MKLIIVLVLAISLNAESRYFSDKQRSIIYLRDSGTCGLCGKFVTLRKYDTDHVLPWSKGGKTTLNNGQVTHQSCNRSKGNRYKK